MLFESNYHDVWAIKASLIPRITGIIERADLLGAEESEVAAIRATKFGRVDGTVGVLGLHGVITQKADIWTVLFGGCSTELFGLEFDAMVKDPDVKAIVLDVNSPGGTVAGVPELATKIFDARGSKPIVAVVNSMCASAAFWLSAAADEIIVTPSGEVGSVGVVAIHSEFSGAEEQMGIKTTLIHAGKFKTEGNAHEPLGEEARGDIQRRVDEYYSMFVEDLARFRGVSARTVESRFGQGRMYGPADAIDRKMADRSATFEQVLISMAPRGANTRARARNIAQLI